VGVEATAVVPLDDGEEAADDAEWPVVSEEWSS